MKNLIRTLLLQIVEKIDNEEISSSEDDTMQVVEMLKKYTDKDRVFSKYMAYTYLGVSRATFDKLIFEKKIPKGTKVSGFKELQWYYKDLKEYKDSLERK